MNEWDRRIRQARENFARGVRRMSEHALCAGCHQLRLYVLLKPSPYGALCAECYDGIASPRPPAPPAE